MPIHINHNTAAAKVNRKAGFEGLHVYGLLTNLEWALFYSYNPTSKLSNTFCQDNKMDLGKD
jgi:hypothetical protein